MSETTLVPQPSVTRKAHVIVTHALGEPCPVGYQVGDHVSVDLEDPAAAFRCPGVQEALAAFIGVAQQSGTPEPLRFVASCACPHSKAEVVFHLRVSPRLHQPTA